MKQNTNEDWFIAWFNTPYYHLLYRNRNEKEARYFIDNICVHLELPDQARIIDVGCGKGRHARYLHQLGYNVTGIDLSPKSIEQANAMKTDGLSFFVHDMRMPYPNGNFDCALNLFTSIGYFEDLTDNQRVIQTCSKALKKNGMLVIDFFNAEKVISNLVGREEKQLEGVKFDIQRVYEHQQIIKKITIFDKGEKWHFEEKVTALKLADFESYFSVSGLKVINLFGDYSLSPFDKKESDRLIMVAQKHNDIKT